MIDLIDRTGQRIEARVPGEGRVSGIVSYSTNAPTHGETQHIIGKPDDGRRAIAVRESQIVIKSRAAGIIVGAEPTMALACPRCGGKCRARIDERLPCPKCGHPLTNDNRIPEERPNLGILVGAIWRDKHDWRRKVTITAVEGDRVQVKRNTSRRTQSIGVVTLTRNYKFHQFLRASTAETPEMTSDRRADRLNELHRGEL